MQDFTVIRKNNTATNEVITTDQILENGTRSFIKNVNKSLLGKAWTKFIQNYLDDEKIKPY